MRLSKVSQTIINLLFFLSYLICIKELNFGGLHILHTYNHYVSFKKEVFVYNMSCQQPGTLRSTSI